jgi:hypothetical protein
MEEVTARLPELENVLSHWIRIVGNGIEVFGVIVWPWQREPAGVALSSPTAETRRERATPLR